MTTNAPLPCQCIAYQPVSLTGIYSDNIIKYKFYVEKKGTKTFS